MSNSQSCGWLAVGLSKLIALSLLCKYVNSPFLLMRARMHGGWPHSSRYKSTAHVHLAIMTAWWPMGKSSSCLSSSRGLEFKEPRRLGGASTLLWAAMQSFIWKQLCQTLVLFLEATVGRAGPRLDMECCAVNLQGAAGSSERWIHPGTRLDNALILCELW